MFTISLKRASDPFRVVKVFCKVLGVISYEKNSNAYILSVLNNVAWIFIQLAMILPSFVFLSHNLNNVPNAIEVLRFLFPAILYLIKYFILIFTKPNLARLLNEFEDLIRSSTYRKQTFLLIH